MSRLLRRSKRASASLIPEITLTPLIDTALTLLVIFMVTSPLINNGIKVDLPKGNAQETNGLQEELVLHIDNKQQLFLNNIPVKRADLISQLKIKVGTNKNKTVFVKGDKNINYGTVLELVDDIKTVGGIDRVALATVKMA